MQLSDPAVADSRAGCLSAAALAVGLLLGQSMGLPRRSFTGVMGIINAQFLGGMKLTV